MSCLSSVYVIADQQSIRFPYLKSELDTIIGVLCSNIQYVYRYTESNIPDEEYKRYYGLFPFNRKPVCKLDYEQYCSNRAFAVVLNHLECLREISRLSNENWSLICEDDIFIEDKENFHSSFLNVFHNRPVDADLLWISSGKKELNCTYRNITGRDAPPEFNYSTDKRYCKLPESRYADCVLIKNNVASRLLSMAEEYKITYPIDWEYNFWLITDSSINSYWLQPAIIRQNPKFFTPEK